MRLKTTLYILLFILSFKSNGQEKIDLLIINAVVYTVNANNQQVGAVAIDKGVILATGDKESLEVKYRAAEVKDINGMYLYPGFIDAHCHFSGYALDKYKCELTGTNSFTEILERLKAYEQTNKYEWIYGRGWDQNNWTIKEFPNKEQLDNLFPTKPVILKRIDGHAILCNQKALDLAGINEQSKVEGGQFINNKEGKLTGVLVDNAMNEVEKLIKPLGTADAKRFLQETEQECFKLGLTYVVDCGVTSNVIKQLEDLYISKTLQIGNAILLSQETATLDKYVTQGPYKVGQLNVCGIKVYADGALGSRGACLLHNYSDAEGQKGTMLCSKDDVTALGKQALQYHWQLCTHAIGDSANRVILNSYAALLKGNNDYRWRIEHAQVVNQNDFHYFKQYSIIPSVQPTHAVSDMHWAESRLGEQRMQTAYAYKQLLQQNGWIALGTDFPVEAINPLATFYAAVARKDNKGLPAGGFQRENALNREQALRGMTIWAAKSVFMEKEKGSIEAGKDADMVILDRDIMKINPEDIMKSKVIMTICKGRVVYQ